VTAAIGTTGWRGLSTAGGFASAHLEQSTGLAIGGGRRLPSIAPWGKSSTATARMGVSPSAPSPISVCKRLLPTTHSQLRGELGPAIQRFSPPELSALQTAWLACRPSQLLNSRTNGEQKSSEIGSWSVCDFRRDWIRGTFGLLGTLNSCSRDWIGDAARCRLELHLQLHWYAEVGCQAANTAACSCHYRPRHQARIII